METALGCPTCGKEMDCSGLKVGDTGVCKHCGTEFEMAAEDSTSDQAPGPETASAVAMAKTGGNVWRVVATVFSIVDALTVIWFIVRAGDVLATAVRLAGEQAKSAMQASQIYSEATMTLLYYICIILALLLGQVCALGVHLKGRGASR